jgi:hypothetical protein
MDVSTVARNQAHFTAVTSIFGSGYVPEQHAEAGHSHLPSPEIGKPALSFDNLLRALRGMLSLR